jgi:hypothetical protein
VVLSCGYAFCVMSMPVIVPVKPVIVAKISLFQACSAIMCVISRAVRLMVVAIVNFTMVTKRGSGGISIVRVRFRMRFVNACLIQSFVVCHLLLFLIALSVLFAADEKTV